MRPPPGDEVQLAIFSNLFWVELAISAILLMIVMGVLVVALTRYSRTPSA
jgi:hypothetical protein